MTCGGGAGCTGARGCGCFTGTAVSTPAAVTNRPGQQAISYRPGTHATFMASMLANLSLLADSEALGDLRARDDGDLAIALLDAWAAAADVHTFYTERIANENYLRTATERRSILELAREVGYELSPGVAASTYLAFTMQDAPGAAPSVSLPAGTKVQSVPLPGQTPVAFETIEAVQARPAWNSLAPQQADAQTVEASNSPVTLVFAGTSTNLTAGDGLLFPVTEGGVCFGVVTSVATVPSGSVPGQGITNATVTVLGRPQSVAGFPASGPAAALPPQVSDLAGQTLDVADLAAQAARQGFSVPDLLACLAQSASSPQPVLALRTRAAIFGNNAPAFSSLPPNLTGYQLVYDSHKNSVAQAGPYYGRGLWTGQDLAAYEKVNPVLGPGVVLLDSTYPQAATGQLAVFRGGDTWAAATLQDVADTSRSDFTMSAKVTELSVDTSTPLDKFFIATTTVYLGGDLLTLAGTPIPDPVTGTTVQLDGWIDGLQAGQWITVSGSRSDFPGVQATEVTRLTRVQQVLDADTGGTVLTLDPKLAFSYIRSSMAINANVARATQGETVSQVLGSGDASAPFQTFALNNQAPLTYVSAGSASGAQSTLSLRASGLLWQETPYLYGNGPAARVYVTRIADGGAVTVEGGDGTTGARFPTGQENIKVVYRKGTGLAGMVQAGQLTLLSGPAPSVRSVTNPVSATGGADPEVLADARRNAPLSALTLGRVVSLQDYQDFARMFPGVAKALATWSADGPVRGVMITIAGPGGEVFQDSSQTVINLLAALASVGDPFVPLRVVSFTPLTFTVAGAVKVDQAYDPAAVLAAAGTALQAAFSFQARDFGQDVAVSQVLQVIHSVPGVVAVELTSLAPTGGSPGLPSGGLVLSGLPVTGGPLASLVPAELLTIDSTAPDLGVM
jgi:hypothetical protein